MVRHLAFAVLLAGCGSSSGGGMGGPTLSGRMQNDDPPPPDIQSNDILARDAVTGHASVQHILVSWRGLAGGPDDPRAKKRTRADADELAQKLLARVRAGEAMEALMNEFSEDLGSADNGKSYDVTADAQLVFEFKRLALRLHPGEAGLVLSGYGWHIMKRVK